jgi:hypothetical protein
LIGGAGGRASEPSESEERGKRRPIPVNPYHRTLKGRRGKVENIAVRNEREGRGGRPEDGTAPESEGRGVELESRAPSCQPTRDR